MTAHWLRRCVVLAVLGLAFAWPLRGRSTQALAAPEPARIRFDEITVDPPRFSPNGDGRSDVQRISCTVSQRVESLYVRVLSADRSVVLHTLLGPLTVSAGGRASTNWNGLANGLPLPDGNYVLDFSAITAPGGAPLHNERPTTIDLTAPSVSIQAVTPALYTPTVPGTPADVRVTVEVSNAINGDQLIIVAKKKTQEFPMRLLGSFIGNGIYTAICDSCTKAKTFPDSTYLVEVRGSDAAANADTSRSQFDKNIRGPRALLTHPILPPPATTATYFVQRADSITGAFSDRHRIDSPLVGGVRIVQVGGATTVGDIVRRSASVDTLFPFKIDLATPLAAEGRYTVALRPRDVHGVVDSSVLLTYVVDRTPPPKPILSPRPNPVSKVDRVSVTLEVDEVEAARVVRSGGADSSRAFAVTGSILEISGIPLLAGANLLSFTAFDLSGNASPPETTTVVFETSQGFAVPERFHAGNSIQVQVGDVPAIGVEVLIYATDGNLVRRFESLESRLVYVFPWDLESGDGRRVKNGAYLLHGIVHEANGQQRRMRKLIAVVE